MTEEGKTIRYLVVATTPFNGSGAIECVSVEITANPDLKLEAREAAARGVNEIAFQYDWSDGDGNEWPPRTVFVLRLLGGQAKALSLCDAKTGPAPDEYQIAELQCCGGLGNGRHTGLCPNHWICVCGHTNPVDAEFCQSEDDCDEARP